MIASSLLEAAASLAITTIVLATLTASLGATAVTSLAAWSAVHEALEERHREHLLEATFRRARETGGTVAACSTTEITLDADLDGNGSIDASSAERTAFVIAARSGGKRALSQRIGGQSMTLTDTLSASAEIVCRDAFGVATAEPTAIRVVDVPVGRNAYRSLSSRFSP